MPSWFWKLLLVLSVVAIPIAYMWGLAVGEIAATLRKEGVKEKEKRLWEEKLSKGVELLQSQTHAKLVAAVQAVEQALEIWPDDRGLQVLPCLWRWEFENRAEVKPIADKYPSGVPTNMVPCDVPVARYLYFMFRERLEAHTATQAIEPGRPMAPYEDYQVPRQKLCDHLRAGKEHDLTQVEVGSLVCSSANQ